MLSIIKYTMEVINITESNKVERKVVVLEVIKHIKNLKFVSIIGIVAILLSMVIPYITPYFYVIDFAFMIPFLFFLYKSNGELTRLSTKYNIEMKTGNKINNILSSLSNKNVPLQKTESKPKANNPIDQQFFNQK